MDAEMEAEEDKTMNKICILHQEYTTMAAASAAPQNPKTLPETLTDEEEETLDWYAAHTQNRQPPLLRPPLGFYSPSQEFVTTLALSTLSTMDLDSLL
jgi:hypothetical protein